MFLCAAPIGPEAARWVGLDVGLILQSSTGVKQKKRKVTVGSADRGISKKIIKSGKAKEFIVLFFFFDYFI